MICKYSDHTRTRIDCHNPDGSSSSMLVINETAQALIAAGLVADPDPEPVLPPPPPTLAERLEAAEALIDMMLEAGGEVSNG
jgi:hypothetical protein